MAHPFFTTAAAAAETTLNRLDRRDDPSPVFVILIMERGFGFAAPFRQQAGLQILEHLLG
ncbi:hypothetical protein D3C73_1276210 [compost metagenome]